MKRSMITGVTPRITANFSRPADNTAYTAGDLIANSTTAASVVPIKFAMPRPSGRISGVRCVVTPATGNLVITALDFDLLLFRPATNIPFTAGSYPADNGACAVTAAAFRELVGAFRFSSASWRNPVGTLVAGATGYQSVPVNSSRPYAPFNIDGMTDQSLIGIVQVLAAWTPTGVINRFDFALDVDQD